MIDKANTVRETEVLDWKRLNDYLVSRLDIEGFRNFEVLQFHGGHANLTYLLKYDDQEFVLRRPPFGKLAPGAHDMQREFRVLSKLYKYLDLVPRGYLYCEDTEVIGAPFVIVERRSGVVIRKTIPECFIELPDIENRLSSALVSAMVDLHAVDYKDAGLETLGNPEGYLNRQLAGWTKRWHLSKTEEVDEMEEVLNELSRNIPVTQKASIVHNDLKLDNCQFQENNPDKVSSIFDWDMCTIGDPLLDFGTALSYWPDQFMRKSGLPIMVKGQFPEKTFLKELYTEGSGLNLDNMQWYEAMAFVRLVVIAQQLYARFVQGATKDKRMAQFGQSAKFLAKCALNTLK